MSTKEEPFARDKDAAFKSGVSNHFQQKAIQEGEKEAQEVELLTNASIKMRV